MHAAPIRLSAARRACTAIAVVLALSTAACRHERGLSRPPPGAPEPGPERIEARKKVDPATGHVVHEWSVLVAPGRPPVKHGRETIWSPEGKKRAEREYSRGKPNGVWRSYYSDGVLQSESFFGDASVETRMSFWYRSGKLRMQGPAVNGVRCGRWKIFYDDGALAEEGNFVGSLREGEWKTRSKDGSTCAVIVYERNVRTDSRPVPCDEPSGS